MLCLYPRWTSVTGDAEVLLRCTFMWAFFKICVWVIVIVLIFMPLSRIPFHNHTWESFWYTGYVCLLRSNLVLFLVDRFVQYLNLDCLLKSVTKEWNPAKKEIPSWQHERGLLHKYMKYCSCWVLSEMFLFLTVETEGGEWIGRPFSLCLFWSYLIHSIFYLKAPFELKRREKVSLCCDHF